MYDREFAWDEKGEEISFEEVRAIRYHSYKSPFFIYPGKEIISQPGIILVWKVKSYVIHYSAVVEKENKQPQVNAPSQAILKPAEPIKEISPQGQVAAKENASVEVNQAKVEAKPAQPVKQNSRVRFSDVFEHKQGI